MPAGKNGRGKWSPHEHDHGTVETRAGVRIDEPGSVVLGQTISEWTEDWWKWALQAPNDPQQNPLLDTTGQAANFNNSGSIFFIGGTWGTGEATRTFDVPAGKPILLPMINAIDTEGPGIATFPDFPGSYGEEAKFLTNLVQRSIYEADATITRLSDGKQVLDVHVEDGRQFAERTDVFALGEPQPGSLLQDNFLGGLSLDPSIADLPFTRSVGKWLMIEGLKPGDYSLEFSGHGHQVDNPASPDTALGPFIEGWGATVHDTIHVVAPVS